MDKDYQNFMDRMGSFEDSIDLMDDSTVNRRVVTRNQNALKHYGIMGMKWGVRKGVNANVVGAAARTGQSVSNLGQTVNRGGFNKKTLKEARKLSDDELKQLTNRLNLENNYINAKNQQLGRGKVDAILSTSAAAFGVVASAAVMVEAIKKARGD